MRNAKRITTKYKAKVLHLSLAGAMDSIPLAYVVIPIVDHGQSSTGEKKVSILLAIVSSYHS